MGPYLKPSVHPTLLMCDAGLFYEPGMGNYDGSMGAARLHYLARGDCATSDSTSLNATQVQGRNVSCYSCIDLPYIRCRTAVLCVY